MYLTITTRVALLISNCSFSTVYNQSGKLQRSAGMFAVCFLQYKFSMSHNSCIITYRKLLIKQSIQPLRETSTLWTIQYLEQIILFSKLIILTLNIKVPLCGNKQLKLVHIYIIQTTDVFTYTIVTLCFRTACLVCTAICMFSVCYSINFPCTTTVDQRRSRLYIRQN